jgi:hypothetical protein
MKTALIFGSFGSSQKNNENQRPKVRKLQAKNNDEVIRNSIPFFSLNPSY